MKERQYINQIAGVVQSEPIPSHSRKVCGNCGNEITNREKFKIFSDEAQQIITVCSLCLAWHIREKALNHGNG